MTKAVHLSRGTLVCVGLLSGIIATAELGNSIEFSSISVLADRLRAEQNIEFNVLQRVAAKLEVGTWGVSCRTDVLADALTVHLHYLDHLDDVQNYDEWAHGIQRASKFVELAIRCSPADGSLWARLAMLRQAGVSVPDEFAELLRRSIQLSPAQVNVILARFEVWRALDPISYALLQEDITSDIQKLVAFGRVKEVKQAFLGLGLQIKMNIRRQMNLVGYERAKYLYASGLQIQ